MVAAELFPKENFFNSLFGYLLTNLVSDPHCIEIQGFVT